MQMFCFAFVSIHYDLYDLFAQIFQDYFIGTGATTWLPQGLWIKKARAKLQLNTIYFEYGAPFLECTGFTEVTLV